MNCDPADGYKVYDQLIRLPVGITMVGSYDESIRRRYLEHYVGIDFNIASVRTLVRRGQMLKRRLPSKLADFRPVSFKRVH